MVFIVTLHVPSPGAADSFGGQEKATEAIVLIQDSPFANAHVMRLKRLLNNVPTNKWVQASQLSTVSTNSPALA